MFESTRAKDDETEAAALSEAARLAIRMKSGDWTTTDQAQLDAWLREKENAVAFEKVMHADSIVERFSAAPSLLSLRAEALNRAGRSRWKHWGGYPARLAVHAASLLVAVGLLVFLGMDLFSPGIVAYETGIGEQRVIELADTTRIALDARTSLKVRLTGETRFIQLERGQAQFDVAHDAGRPFIVETGIHTVRAIGTSFNIECLGDRVDITLLEGKVAVNVGQPAGRNQDRDLLRSGSPADSGTLELKPGERLRMDRDGRSSLIKNADVTATTAWRQGKVVLDSTPLKDAVRRLNRYSRLQIRIEDESLGDEIVNGIFDSGDTEAFIEAVRSTLPVTVDFVDENLVRVSSGQTH